MARKTFEDILSMIGFNVENEYQTLYSLMYETGIKGARAPLYYYAKDNFIDFSFRDTFINFDKFNEVNGFNFIDNNYNSDLDYYLLFCEYVYSITCALIKIDELRYNFYIFIIRHIESSLHKGGFIIIRSGEVYKVVEGSPELGEAMLAAPSSVAPRIVEYRHRSLVGDLEGKKTILLDLANYIEPRRNDLRVVSSKLEDTLFNAFNNLNLRHNNVVSGNNHYHEYVANMSDSELEDWYDRVHEMCMEAVLALKRFDDGEAWNELKENI